MTEYLSEKEKTFKLQKGYKTGDVVILSDDMAAWRVKKTILTEGSSVFAGMFAQQSSNSKEISLPDIPRLTMDLFIRALHNDFDEQDPIRMYRLNDAADVLLRFECDAAARNMLYPCTREIYDDDIFDALVLASKLNDLQSACRIIAQGWRAEVSEEKSILPVSRLSTIEYSEEICWRAADGQKFQPSWVWALTIAQYSTLPTANARGWTCGDKEFWRLMVGEFMANLVDA